MEQDEFEGQIELSSNLTQEVKIEVTANYVRIPVAERMDSDNIVTLTINKQAGILALYCTNRKKILTYLFDKTKWTLDKAQAWITEHKNSSLKEAVKSIFENLVDKEQFEATQKKFLKVDFKEWIVYLEILVPWEVDLQGDFESPEDIRKAMVDFMKYYGFVGDMHRNWDGIGKVIENFQVPNDVLTFDGAKVIPGSWVAGIFVDKESTRDKIRMGVLTGASIGYNGNHEEIET